MTVDEMADEADDKATHTPLRVPKHRQTIELARLRLARNAAGPKHGGYNTTEMGQRMGKSQSWVSSVERGTQTMTLEQVALWAEVTGCGENYLYGFGKLLGGR